MTPRLSAARFVWCAAIVLVAIIVAPYAWVPVFNMADVVVIAAPFALLAAGWPRDRPPRRRDRIVTWDPQCDPDDLDRNREASRRVRSH